MAKCRITFVAIKNSLTLKAVSFCVYLIEVYHSYSDQIDMFDVSFIHYCS